MKKMIISMMLAAATIPVATSLIAQDDIYYTKKNAQKAIYSASESDNWSTNANDDWDLDSYNRRGGGMTSTAPDTEAAAFTATTDGTLQYNGSQTQVVHDTLVYLVEVDPYAYTSRIHRFHNPLFGYYAYSPWYDIAFYDPFYWDYCYWDPWWWRTPSFGYHWGSWYVGWNPGYYGGWYGGWYSPYYHLHPHHFGPVWGGGHYYPRHHTNRGSRNNMGGHFRGQPGMGTGVRGGGTRGGGNVRNGGSSRVLANGNTRTSIGGGSNRATLPSTRHNANKSNMGTRTQSTAVASGSRPSTSTAQNRTSVANTTRQQASQNRNSRSSQSVSSQSSSRSSSSYSSTSGNSSSYSNSSRSSSSYSSGSSSRGGGFSGGSSSGGGSRGGSSGGGSRGGRR